MSAPAPNRTDLLDQTEVWVDREGETVRVDDMPLSYLAALQKFLENRSGTLRAAHAHTAFVTTRRASERTWNTVMGAVDDDDRVTPAEYMSRYPLYRRISVLLGDRRFESDADVQWPAEGPF